MFFSFGVEIAIIHIDYNSMGHGVRSFDEIYYKRFFNDYSSEELNLYYRWSLGWMKFLENYLPLKNGRGRRVLELGSSIGAFSKVLNERGFDVLATDISSYIISKAKKLQPKINFKVMDIEKDPKLEEKFDIVFAFETLEHLQRPAAALRSIKKLLKKDGIFIFSTPFPTKASLSDPTHINVHYPSWWKSEGKKAGFAKRTLIYATFIPYLYRLSSVFSKGFPIKTDLPFVNSTCFFLFSVK